jgi:adenosylcobinamide-GDP ribazoletransferase
LALSFLTIIPAYGNQVADDKEMAKSLYYYPLVGFIIGAFLALLAWLSHLLGLAWGGDALILVSWIIISGGLHLDGLMDSADGLFSGRDRERKLEIMKDSRVGAMGGIALVSVVLLKFTLIASLDYADRLWVLFLTPAVGRCFMVYAVLLFPYARSGPGLGKCFGDLIGKDKLVGATLILLVGAVLAAKLAGVVFILLTAIPISLVAIWISHSLGGQTGDTYGAICEVSETMFLVVTTIGMAIYTLL